MDLGRGSADPGTPGARAGWGPVAGSLVGLMIAFLTLAGCQCDARPTVIVGLLLAWPLVVAAVLRTRRAWIAAAYLLGLGVVFRLGILVGFHGVGPAGVASDVLTVTREALGVLLAGGNPYTHAYIDFNPSGSTHVFPHPAGNLLYYLPGFVLWGERMRATEIVSAGVVLAVLAWSTRIVRSDLPVALMGLYAAAPPLLILATDNSNDTSAGALIFLAAFALLLAHRRRSPGSLALAGAVMGWAMSFKLYALVFWPFFTASVAAAGWTVRLAGGARPRPAWWFYTAASLGVAGLLNLPFLLWAPSDFMRSLWTGPTYAQHGVGGWNVWGLLEAWPRWRAADALGPSGIMLVNLGLALTAIATGLVAGVRHPARAVLFGILVWFVTMFTARWTTYAYFAGIAPVLLLLPLADRLAAPPSSDEEKGRSPHA